VAAGLVAVLLLAVGLAKGAAKEGGRECADRWLEPFASRVGRLPLVRRVRRPVWVLAATVVAFLLPVLRHPGADITGVFALGLFVLAVAVTAVHARSLVVRRAGGVVRQEAWGPGVLFGLGAGALGTPWAPLPVVAEASDTGLAAPAAQRVHWAAPVILAVLSVVLFGEVDWLDVPLVRSVAVATLVMAASILVPTGTDGWGENRQGAWAPRCGSRRCSRARTVMLPYVRSSRPRPISGSGAGATMLARSVCCAAFASPSIASTAARATVRRPPKAGNAPIGGRAANSSRSASVTSIRR
jgi:hypothetical protein